MKTPHPYIPYFETSRIRVTAMIELADIKAGERVADLGCGDGRIAIAFGKHGGIVTGFELDIHSLEIARNNVKIAQLEQNVTLKQSDFWTTNLSEFDIVAVYPMPDIMQNLEYKLMKELKPGARIVINYYPLPNIEFQEKKENVYVYKIIEKAGSEE